MSRFDFRDDEAIDYVAMQNVPYVSYFDSEEMLIDTEKRIAVIRAWAKNQADKRIRQAYDKWLDAAEYCIGQTRKRNAQMRKVNEIRANVPVPPRS